MTSPKIILPLHLGYVFANNDLINVNVNTRLSANVLLMVRSIDSAHRGNYSSLTLLTTSTGYTGYLEVVGPGGLHAALKEAPTARASTDDWPRLRHCSLKGINFHRHDS